MQTAKDALIQKYNESLPNLFGENNHWAERFGPYVSENRSFVGKLRGAIRPVKEIVSDYLNRGRYLKKLEDFLEEYGARFALLYNILDEESKAMVVELIAFRLFGFRKVKLSTSTPEIWNAIDLVKKHFDTNDYVTHSYYPGVQIQRTCLKYIGFDIDFYYLTNGVLIDFIAEQYAFKLKNGQKIMAEPGDVVLELGACWGATGLYFAEKVGPKGKVYSFEFIPENIDLFNKNIDLNPLKKEVIQLVPFAISNVSDKDVFIKNEGASSTIKSEAFDGYSAKTKTIAIDDFVERNNISKVDFISMDIEGAELAGLEGSIRTIRKHKPKLAISIYHSMHDFVEIPLWIQSLNMGYNISIGHYTIYGEETVCFAY